MVAPAVAAAIISSAAALGGSALSTFGRSSGGGYSGPDPLTMSMLNYQHQKEFAQNAIQWRVADAKAAGLHPLAALGASPLGFSPSFSGGIPSSSDWDYSAMGDAIGKMGQNIGRAIEAQATEKERAEAADYTSKARALDLENKELQNQTLRQKIFDNAMASVQAVKAQAGQPPAMQQVIPTGLDGRTLPGQGDAHTTILTKTVPIELLASHPQTPHATAGTQPENQYFRAGDGGYSHLRSSEAAQVLEDDTLGSARYNVRNGLGTFFSEQSYAPPRDYLPNRGRDPDYYWIFDNLRGTWHPARHSDGGWKNFKRSIGIR